MNSIYNYTNYRDFLKDRYLALKARDSQFSYQRFSREAGIKSPNYLKLVIDGTRNLTVSNIHEFAKGLKLTETETDYFETLVLSTQATSPREKKFYRSRLLKIKATKISSQSRMSLKNLGQFPYLPAILVAANGLKAANAAEVIAGRLPIPPEQVKKILAKLREEKIVEEKNDLIALTSDFYVQFDNLRANADQKTYLKAQLDLSAKALEARYGTDAQFFAHTFTTNPERLPRMIQKIASLLEEVTNESSEDPPENVMQLNIQFFPLGTR